MAGNKPARSRHPPLWRRPALSVAPVPAGRGSALGARRGLDRLWEPTDPLELARGEYLYLPGDPARSVFLLREGSVRLARLLDSGGELNLDVAGPGEVVGEDAVLVGGPRRVLAQALEPLRASPLPASVVEAAARRDPEVALALARITSERARRLEARATLNAFGGCPRRLAGVLLEMADRFGEDEEDGRRIVVRLTHEDLARFVGAARETVTPLLVALRRRGVIDYDRRRIVIRDRRALAS